MDKKVFQNTILEKQYQPAKWQEVLKDYFGVKKLHQQPQPIILPANDIAENAVELGSFYTADDRLVGIYEIKIKTEATTRIDINRVGLRSLLRNIYKYDVDAALIVFVHGSKWRFSYVSEIRTEEGKKETEPKRYTYLFGENESCRTAADRFDKLKGKQIYLNDLFEAFSVEKLNKDFFKTYKEFHERFWKFLADDDKYYNLFCDKRQEDKVKREKPIRDFAKKLLGRIVFLQFLQKKGWMGVSANTTEWIGGDPKFLQSLFAKSSNKSKFHSTELKDLFFKTLNLKRDNDIAPESLGKYIKIPYLNGGLFDKDISFENSIDFPEEYFAQLLDFFEQYNFTIDENDPYDCEVGIDPEMLGHIFENLLEENREKGAFYTPKEIVHYMCQESLIQYLRTHLPECTEDDSPATKALENFIRNGIIGDRHDKKNFVVQQAKRIEKLLDNVKICDPAIGSGAFPMGILQEIFKAKTSLDLTLDHAEVKRQIIQNNIYGVDIEPGAVDIARLRFWLALVVDETEPQPLPNLDYKIMQGNSLLEQFEDISLKFEKKIFEVKVVKDVDLFGRPINPQYTINEYLQTKQSAKEFDITELEEKYFNSNNADEKQQIREKIENFERQFILEQLDEREKQIKEILNHKENDFEKDLNAVGETEVAYLCKGKKAKDIEKQKTELEKIKQYRKRLNDIKPNEKPWFLWYLYFMDVFDKGGFDVVIGNPPYIQIKWLENKTDISKANFKTFSNSGDIYWLFYELANELLSERGIGTYITSNKWLRSEYGNILRNYFYSNSNPLQIIDFGGVKIFETASVDTNIFVWRKEIFSNICKSIRLDNDTLTSSLFDVIKSNIKDIIIRVNDVWSCNSDYVIRDKIEKDSIRLKDFPVELNYGILTGANPVFIISGQTRNQLIKKDNKNSELIKPILRGKDLVRFGYNFSDIYLILAHNGIKAKKIKPINIPREYPSLLEYFESFGESFANRGEKGDNWYNLRNCKYIEEFEKNKIIYADIVQSEGKFYYDERKFYTNDTAFIITGENLKYLVCILNSKLISFSYRFFYSGGGLGDKGLRYKKEFLEKVPISNIRHEHDFNRLVDKISILKTYKLDSSKYENKIDALVFHLYNLTESEMLQVLDTFKDLSIKDRNQIHNEYWNIANNKFQLEI